MIKISENNTLEEIEEMYYKIFHDSLLTEKNRLRVSSKNTKNYILWKESEKIGFCIIEQRNDGTDWYIWLAGVLKEFRKKGYWKYMFRYIEAKAEAEKIEKISLSTYNHRPEMIISSVKQGFRIISTSDGTYGDGIKINMEYSIKDKKESRDK